MRKRKSFRVYLGNGYGSMLLLLIASRCVLAVPTDPYEKVNKSWDRLGLVYGRIVENYYADIDQEEIMQAAIDGMLGRLDSYSQFYDEDGLRRLRQDTTGKFAGLGITVGIKDQYPVVIAPIEGTPAARAGLLPGDLIVDIEGRDTRNMPLEDVVDILRGEPGTLVRLKVAHGVVEGAITRELTITREIIEIKSVTLVEEVESGIGYIGMRHTRFSENTAEEVESALKMLKSRQMRGIILDLRGNPGGLLTQATQVADLFLPQGVPIVSVKERDGRRTETKHSQRKPVAGDLPMVVLIDGGSASASEIVAGAIQDNDRGIILGTASFGKGSVQTIFDLHEVEESALKLTTALYYTPSGRSIHSDTFSGFADLSFQLPLGEKSLPASPTLGILLRAGNLPQAKAFLRARFGLDPGEIDRLLATPLGDLVGFMRVEVAPDSSCKEVFYTRKGRMVYGGGGITPDISVEADPLPEYVQELDQHRLFFGFVVDYVYADTARSQAFIQQEQEDEMVVAFSDFLRQKEVDSRYARAAYRELDILESLIAEMGWGSNVRASIDSVRAEIDKELGAGITSKLEPYIRKGLKRELALIKKGRLEQLRVGLEQDPQLEKAIEVLRDSHRYREVLGNGAS